jgi:hypothetical protein
MNSNAQPQCQDGVKITLTEHSRIQTPYVTTFSL